MGVLVGYLLYDHYRYHSSHRGETNLSPPDLAQQGSFIPLQGGRRRVGAVIGWAGSRYARNENTTSSGGFGKGSKKKSGGQTVFYEAGWHQICVGPAKVLHRIWQDGKVIWTGPINSTDDPSGSSFTADDGSAFTIYWGEPDQPIDPVLSDASRVGIASRWPHLCYVVWTNKRLGSQPRWPQIEYDIECATYTNRLDTDYPGLTTAVPTEIAGPPTGQNAAYLLGQILFESYPHGLGLDASTWSIFGGASDPCSTDTDTVTGSDGDLLGNDLNTQGLSTTGSGPETIAFDQVLDPVVDAGWYRVDGIGAYLDGIDMHRDGGIASGTGARFDRARITLSDGVTTYTLLDAAIPYATVIGPGDPDVDVDCWTAHYSGATHYHRQTQRRYLELTPGTWTIHVEVDVDRGSGGGSAAGHFVVDSSINLQELESPVVTPAGAGGGSFYDLVTAIDAEGQVGSVTAADGVAADEVINALLDEMGVMVHRDYANEGLNSFTLIRETTPVSIPDAMIHPQETESEIAYGDRDINKAMFTFQNVARQFKDSVLAIDSDGDAQQVNQVKGQTISLQTVVDFDVATKVAERRNQEVVDPAKFSIYVGRGARKFSPGMLLSLVDLPVSVRLTDVKIEADDDKVELNCVADYYGAPASTHFPEDVDSPGGDTEDPVDNLEVTWFEMPALAGEPSVPNIVPLRIRANQRMTQEVIHLSPDGVSYREVIRDNNIQTGGVLTEDIDAEGWQIENGPTFDVEGADLTDVVEDLTSDEIGWRAGRQCCLIGDELFFLRNVEALGGTSYRLRGLIRARYETERAAHDVDDPVFIFSSDAMEPFYDSLLSPGATLYVKQQALGINGAVDLGTVPAVTRTLEGRGVVPMRPGPVYVTAPRSCVDEFKTGEDVSVAWTYRSLDTPNSGSDLVVHDAAYGIPIVQGTFEVQVLTTGDVLKATVNTGTTPSRAILNSELVTWFAGEPAAFKVRVYNINGGFRSGYVERTIVRV